MGQVTTPRQSVVLHPGDAICASNQLQNGGQGVRFLVEYNGRTGPAFVVRHAGRAVAYLNRCAHKLVELDWQEGKFFDAKGDYLVCTSHGALYDPDNGICIGGPCRGAALTIVPVRESDASVWLVGESSTVFK